jgi:ABC-type amino acid transport substrate-binding protein
MKKIFLLFFLIISPIFANQKFVIGVENIDYYPLYSYKDGKYEGYSRALLDMFAKERGYTFEYKAYAINRLYKAFLSNQVDFKYPDNNLWMSSVREGKNIIYSKPITDYIDGAMVKPKNIDKKIDNIKTLGTVMGFTPFDYLELIDKNKIKLSENPNFGNLLKQTIVGRIDMAYGNITVAKYQLKHILNKENSLLFNPNLPHSKSSYLLSTIKHKKVINELNEFLKNNSEKIKKLKKEYEIE